MEEASLKRWKSLEGIHKALSRPQEHSAANQAPPGVASRRKGRVADFEWFWRFGQVLRAPHSAPLRFGGHGTLARSIFRYENRWKTFYSSYNTIVRRLGDRRRPQSPPIRSRPKMYRVLLKNEPPPQNWIQIACLPKSVSRNPPKMIFTPAAGFFHIVELSGTPENQL